MSSRRTVASWCFYDFANTIFSMNVVSLYFPLWLTADLGASDLWVSLANSASMALVALSMPLLGVLADHGRRRRAFLVVFTAAACAFTALIGMGGRVSPAAAVVAFIAANYAYQGGLVFYNALLPAVAGPAEVGRISGYGVALGYLGAIAGMIFVLPFATGSLFGWHVPFITGGGRAATFLPTAVLFALFAMPCLLWVTEASEPRPAPARGLSWVEAFGKVRETLTNARLYPGLRAFLVAKFLYEEAIATVIIFMAVYANRVWGFTDSELTPFFILSTVSAVAGSLVLGRLVDRVGPKRTLEGVLVGWLVCLVVLALARHRLVAWVLGSAIGICLGGTWTAARPLLVRLVPGDELGEFFGLYAMSGKVAAIVGPLVWGGIVWAAAGLPGALRYRLAVAVLAVMVGAGLGILRRYVPSDLERV
ncbi:MAG: MFS transporter [bacterium]|nr:MFS transporter [bacterium]